MPACSEGVKDASQHTASPYSRRCSLLTNSSVHCDGELYHSLRAWKEHKLHVDHEVSKSQPPPPALTVSRLSCALKL